jgi:hypothetical protein
VAEVVNINDVLDGHVVLDLQCLDRVYLNGYVPKLEVGGQVVTFLTEHLGNPLPSPALFKQVGDRFRDAVRHFAETNGIPVLHLVRHVARQINARVLTMQSVGQSCAIETALFERVSQPCASGKYASWLWPAPCV